MRAVPARLTARVAETLDRARTWLRDHVAAVADRFRRARREDARAVLLAPVVVDAVPFADDPAPAEPPEPTARDVAMAFLAECGYRGNWNTRTMRAFRDLQDANMARAERDIRGGPDAMLTREAIAHGIGEATLFYGTEREAMRYASEDLRRWWADNGRLTVAEYRADLLSGTGADARAESDMVGAA